MKHEGVILCQCNDGYVKYLMDPTSPITVTAKHSIAGSVKYRMDADRAHNRARKPQ